jgi:hypothetical protein
MSRASRILALSLILTLVHTALLGADARAANAKLLHPGKPPKRVKQLSWNDDIHTREIEVEPEFYEEAGKRNFRGVIHLTGILREHSGWIIVKGDAKIETSEKDEIQRFFIDVPVEGNKTPLNLFLISPEGKIEEERISFNFPGWADFKKLHTVGPPPQSPLSLVPSVGLTYISYRETLVPDFTESAVTIKFTAAYRFKPSWDVGVTPYLTLQPLSTNQSGVSARFLGANFRVGYLVPFPKEPWRLTLMAGFYYTTTFITDSAFGFKNLMGPQIFPVLRRMLSPRTSLAAYIKFSPVGSGIGISDFANREVAGGLSFTWLQRSAAKDSVVTPYIVSIDASNLTIFVEDTTITSTSMSLSVGMGLF